MTADFVSTTTRLRLQFQIICSLFLSQCADDVLRTRCCHDSVVLVNIFVLAYNGKILLIQPHVIQMYFFAVVVLRLPYQFIVSNFSHLPNTKHHALVIYLIIHFAWIFVVYLAFAIKYDLIGAKNCTYNKNLWALVIATVMLWIHIESLQKLRISM